MSAYEDDVLLDDLFIGFGILIDRLNGRVDEPLEDNDTALHLACLYGHLPCVQVSFAFAARCLFISTKLSIAHVYM